MDGGISVEAGVSFHLGWPHHALDMYEYDAHSSGRVSYGAEELDSSQHSESTYE